MRKHTLIQVKPETAKMLKKRKITERDTYDEIIKRLLGDE